MNLLVPLLIVAINPEAPIDCRYPEATEMFSCNFDASWDQNFDGWPDNWTRRRGPRYPHYLKISLAHDPAPATSRYLRIDLDGGAAAAFSPPIPILPRYSYVLEGLLRTEGLQHDKAFLSLTFLDGNRQRLETFYSDGATEIQSWQKFRLGPISPTSDEARMAVLGLHLEPGAKSDLHGSAMFSDLWLGRLPRMSLAVNGQHHIFTDPSQITITCTASGFADGKPLVTLVLEDVLGHKLAQVEPPLEIQKQQGAPEISLDAAAMDKQTPIGIATWKPPVPGPGFYRVWGLMKGRKAMVHRNGVTLVVLEPTPPPKGGEFGWSLPHGGRPLPLPELATLLCQVGINWVKYPLWYDQDTSDEEATQLLNFNERLAGQGINMVGLLCQPPDKLREHYEHPESVSAAEIFSSSPDLWYPSLELVMMRLATQVRWWQLGADKDTSFVDYPNLTQKIAQIKLYLDRIGQNVNLGLGWNWMAELPQGQGPTTPWRFLSLSSDPPLTDQELKAYLAITRQSDVSRWVVMEPLPAKRYPLQTRACDLLRRMMAAKIQGAEAIFLPDPFDPQCGVLNEDGTPGELLLPWRTTALMLAGSEYIGSIQLPCGSQNQIFARKGTATMVVWNHEPVRETAYFGSEVRQVDLWSRSRVPQQEANHQIIEVGPLPTFVTGLELPLVRWRQSCSLAKDRIPSVFGQKHQNSLQLTNSFGAGVSGEVKLVMPEIWTVHPDHAEFRLAPGEAFRMPFEMALPFNSTSGQHKVRIDLTVHADKTYQFSAYRTMDVGLGDVYVECVTQLKENGDLEVEQRLHNETVRPVSFRCELFVPDRKRMKADILDLGQGCSTRVYHLSDGKKLLGKTLWLRAEEIGGPRVLNYRFLAEP